MKLYNTLTKQVEPFTPRNEGKVQMFVCGPTVYDFSHLGHAKTYIQLDLLARALRASGYDVFYLQNITDIDDKIIDRARERGIDWQDLRADFQREYEQDMSSLGNTSVTTYARATDHIDDIIRQVQTLIDRGFAYTIDGDGIYFEIAKFAEYGKLSGRTEVKKDDAQSRIDESDKKRGWNDFALWKFSKPNEPVWDAQFIIGNDTIDGAGRPGWHIEDTAITEHYFGPQYDVHGGAVDLIFPHHEAEITQMESASGLQPFVRTWVHTGFLTIDGDKMSKSVGNFYTIREVLEKGYNPQAIRLFMLQSHYRSPINFTWDSLDAAVNRLKNWQAIADLRFQLITGKGNALHELETDFNPLYDDLATPQVLARIDSRFSGLDAELVSQEHETMFKAYLEKIDTLLGTQLTQSQDITDEQKQAITEREKVRKAKDWARSDELRDQLAAQGIGLRDTEHGTIWYRL